jgi:hypothetical protein
MTSLKQAVALFAALAVALALAGTAAAVDDDPDRDPPPPKDMPNLVISDGSIAPYGTSEWEIRYTVTNRGTLATPGFHVAVQQNGSTNLKDTYYAGLAPGASRSEIIHISRTGCYIPVRFLADATKVVAESNEFDNQRWVVGLTSTSCPTLPKYQVKAVSFHAADESGIDWTGSDEPYFIFNSVGINGTQHSSQSHVFSDIDTGDTELFGSAEGCLYLSCFGGTAPYGIGFSIQLWEHDLGEIPSIFTNTVTFFDAVGGLVNQWSGTQWAGTTLTKVGDGLNWILLQVWADDLIGSQTYVYDPAMLASKLQSVGATYNDTRTYSDGDAVYTMTVTTTRTG